MKLSFRHLGFLLFTIALTLWSGLAWSWTRSGNLPLRNYFTPATVNAVCASQCAQDADACLDQNQLSAQECAQDRVECVRDCYDGEASCTALVTAYCGTLYQDCLDWAGNDQYRNYQCQMQAATCQSTREQRCMAREAADKMN